MPSTFPIPCLEQRGPIANRRLQCRRFTVQIRVLLSLLGLVTIARADLSLAGRGKSRHVIVLDPAATATEAFAARELAAHLEQITGVTFPVQTNSRAPARAIFIGAGNT